MPKITVLMSVYNGRRYLHEAIESILCQTWSDFEFLIINDGSTDDSRDIILSFDDPRIHLVDNPSNIGLTKSLNLGLQLAQAEYIARQDADDISYPERLKQQVKFLDEHHDVALLGTRARAIDENGKPWKNNLLRLPVGLLAIRWYLIFQNAFIHSSVMLRRSVVWEKLKGYDESFARGQDYELWSRTARSFKVENLSNIFIDYRFDYGSIVSRLPLALAPEEDIAIRNLQVFLKFPDVPVEWGRYINNLRRKENFDQGDDWRQVAEMLDQISSRYCQLYPQARLDKTIRSHLADYLYRLAYCSAPHNRRISLKSYAHARKLAPKSSRNSSLAKYIALWFMGECTRRAFCRIKSSVKKSAVS